MAVGFHAQIDDFLTVDDAHVVGVLAASIASTGIATQYSQQIQVWNDQVSLLKRHFVRSGMVVWVPFGACDDPTRDPARFDRVYAHLEAAGVPNLDSLEKSTL